MFLIKHGGQFDERLKGWKAACTLFHAWRDLDIRPSTIQFKRSELFPHCTCMHSQTHFVYIHRIGSAAGSTQLVWIFACNFFLSRFFHHCLGIRVFFHAWFLRLHVIAYDNETLYPVCLSMGPTAFCLLRVLQNFPCVFHSSEQDL